MAKRINKFEKEYALRTLKERQKLVFKEQPELEELYNILLSHGGDIVVPVYEEDYKNMIKRGQVFSPKKTIMMKGKPSQCHSNSANLWNVNQDTVDLVTGYALSHDEDGIKRWRCHSWAILKKTGQVIETTVKRNLYFGYKMNKKESKKFLSYNS